MAAGVSKIGRFLILFTFRSSKKKEKVKVKKVEKNVSRHPNGTLYFVARRSGKPHVRSPNTDDIQIARKIILDVGDGSKVENRDGSKVN